MVVKMIHPQLPGQSKDDVHEDAVPFLVASGWQVVEDKPPAARAAVSEIPAAKRSAPVTSTGKE